MFELMPKGQPQISQNNDQTDMCCEPACSLLWPPPLGPAQFTVTKLDS